MPDLPTMSPRHGGTEIVLERTDPRYRQTGIELPDRRFDPFAGSARIAAQAHHNVHAAISKLALRKEDRGLRRLTREACDHVVAIPMATEKIMLNASDAATVLLYETIRQRGAASD